MLHFLNSNIYLANELTNDIPGDIWATSYPACVNDYDAPGIYESNTLHKFKYKEFQDNPKWILDKEEVLLGTRELDGFLLSWYDSCAQRRAISNCVDMVEWIRDYRNCYMNLYQATDAYEGALNYYDALALADLNTIDIIGDNNYYYVDMSKLNPIPEVSWMLEDYLKNDRKSVWKNYLTEYIRINIKDMIYRGRIGNRANAGFIPLQIPLDINMTIDDVDFSDERAVWYFDNPYKVDFKTNYAHIAQLCRRHG